MANTLNTQSGNMEWTEQHDIFLCREIIVSNLFKTKKKTVQRAQVWQQIADTLCQYNKPAFAVSKRAVRDRYGVISSKFKKRKSAEERASGIDVEITELDVLLEELVELEDSSNEEGNEQKRKIEEDKAKAADIRQTAMENLAQTKKRQANRNVDGDSVEILKKKTRRSGSDLVNFLKEKGEQQAKLREEEIAMRKKEHELESQRNELVLKNNESFMGFMAQQQQQFQAAMAQQNKMFLNLIEKLNPNFK